MRVAVMQPYLFPYIGYFQLIHAADVFVVLDDVNYIKGGWINRNFILGPGGRQRFTLGLLGASPNVLINEVKVGGNRKKLIKTIRQSYAKAPCCGDVMPLLEDIFGSSEENLALYLTESLQKVCDYLGIATRWEVSSQIPKSDLLRGQDRVLALAQALDAQAYINLPGGRELYSRSDFEEKGIALEFINPQLLPYHQFGGEFEPSLSIIDALMFNDRGQMQALIEAYTVE